MWTDMTKLIIALCSFLNTHIKTANLTQEGVGISVNQKLTIQLAAPSMSFKCSAIEPLIIGVLLAFFLGTFTKLQKVTIIFVMSVYLQGTT